MTTIEKIFLQGFRAYLEPQTIEMSENNVVRNLAIYAPNARGKSSLVDSVEFYFSGNGTLERLGRRRSGILAGPDALISHKADAKGISPQVQVVFRSDEGPYGTVRTVQSPASDRTSDADKVLSLIDVDFVIRGTDLNQFVTESAEDRYESVSEWFGLDALLEIQRAYREVRLGLTDEIDNPEFARSIDARLSRLSDGAVSTWSTEDISDWIKTSILQPLSVDNSVDSLRHDSDLLKFLDSEKTKEENQLGISAIKGLITAFEYLAPSDLSRPPGSLNYLKDYAELAEISSKVFETERTKSKESIFQSVWESADDYLASALMPTSMCPVCETPLDRTSSVDHAGLKHHLEKQLAAITSTRVASEVRATTAERAVSGAALTVSAIERVFSLVSATELEFDTSDLKSIHEKLPTWQPESSPPDIESVHGPLLAEVGILKLKKDEILEAQGEDTFANAHKLLTSIAELESERNHKALYLIELSKLQDAISELTDEANNTIRGHIKAIADSMATDVNDVFSAIQEIHSSAIEIDFVLPPSSDVNQRRLTLTAGVADGREAVAPSGYLSDSEMHTLALSLRLTAIRRFNPEFKCVILDDVVTSYDAEHRRGIASVFATKFRDFQFLLLTHDERFFRFLKEFGKQGEWIYRQIRYIDPDFGPRFDRHLIPDEIVDELFAERKSAANEMRQIEEEWLTGICTEFGADIRIRTTANAFRYDRGELAVSLANFLKKLSLVPPLAHGSNNPFLQSLQQGEVENFGSHFSSDPSTWGDVGDEMHRWNQFKEFRELFKCPECGRKRFQRPDSLKKPLCKNSSCESPFSF